jgi:sialic acid synthase SpsE
MTLAGRPLVPGGAPLRLAATGTAHGGDVQLGYRLVETAGAAGADAVVLERGPLSERDWKSLLGYPGHVGLIALAAPRVPDEVRLLEELDVRALRIRGAERAGRPVLERAAGSGRALVLSLDEPSLEAARDLVHGLGPEGVGLAFLLPDASMMGRWSTALPGISLGVCVSGEAGEAVPVGATLIEFEHRLPAPRSSRRRYRSCD